MKKFLRSPAVQAFLGLMLAGYLILIRRTTRWTHVGLEKVEPTLNSDQGAIGLFWHGRIPLCLGIGQVWWKKPKLRCLVSPSSDGEFIAQALARARFPAIRASSAKKGDSAKARAVVAAFREAMTWVGDGGVLIVTPDGPRGPNEVIASGSLQIAKRTGAPVFLMGLAAAPAIQLDTWDKVMFARPFGRGATVWEGPFHVPRDADDAQIESLIAEWSALLSDATRRAEKLVARRAD
ncbi:lysophospholipid acyltransferase family protein [Phenylobacterium aquaticum]|uniref:lysophospholipid acyltransferase family protein n=1 Tax=Phenylobacterium aquaticum TaxID=1763816 RepID=UPI0026EEF1DA|nr:lysophospholipid acyltransferase family protein [Phenylobacterium aquaticum]